MPKGEPRRAAVCKLYHTVMRHTFPTLTLAAVLVSSMISVQAAEPEQVRMVINLIANALSPTIRNNLALTERVPLDTNSATVACLRLNDKVRWKKSLKCTAARPAGTIAYGPAARWTSPPTHSI
jgi:hypothetical protein